MKAVQRDITQDLWRQMVDMGWAAILVPEAYGGLDFGHVGNGVRLSSRLVAH